MYDESTINDTNNKKKEKKSISLRAGSLWDGTFSTLAWQVKPGVKRVP
jgi:hypothetical protein